MKSFAWTSPDFKIELAKKTKDKAEILITNKKHETLVLTTISLTEIKGIRDVLWEMECDLERSIEEEKKANKEITLAMESPWPEQKSFKDKFDWHNLIKSAKSGAISTRDRQPWEDAVVYSRSWYTNPVSYRAEFISRDRLGRPNDPYLRKLGVDFISAVEEKNLELMETLLSTIQERKDQLVSEKLGKEATDE
ncbi:hypothetical protein DN752_17970 [Echinicola strongylocentroti]|uniref:Uncharacterized protein n=1 Tax=Echinicola strongylocentroti TaxID=1795355 RepID=A0A2Z4IMN1_9BACT|nr:hypothetical protein [Echinicola strongylocentroti]AWW31868.1 hypothetical protein DN752_17970 [Echinicola strongylocentroti]